MDTIQMIQAGAGIGSPYSDALSCKGCGRYIGLHSRDGQLVGMEYHQARVEEDSSILIGWGSSGLGMWRVTRRWVCSWR